MTNIVVYCHLAAYIVQRSLNGYRNDQLVIEKTSFFLRYIYLSSTLGKDCIQQWYYPERVNSCIY